MTSNVDVRASSLRLLSPMPLLRILKHLDSEGVAYQVISHPPAFSAQKIAAAAHVRGREMAKIVMIKIDDQLAMAVLPADLVLDLAHVREATGAESVELASEVEFTDRFPDCEGGAMPPFGNLYGLPVFVADVFARMEYLAFNAGNHREIIRLRFADFVRLVQPRLLALTLQRA
jgi:Ala-tRNA(Pro) deacylase